MTARQVKFAVNGEPLDVAVEPRTRLADVVRAAGLTGTHLACDTGACGACTVLVDGRTVRSCLMLAVQCDGRAVTTIEALGTPDHLHPVMAAFRRNHGLQCGFCTPGMVLAAVELLAEEPDPDAPTVRSWLAGNVCRCTGYAGVVAAVLDAAASRRAGVAGEPEPGS
jgi:carbon-monoxide dehydrogenase small subunit